MRGKYANHKCLIFSNATGIRQDDIVNSPNYEDIAVVELQLCISLTVTECDIDSVTGEIV
ncbi:hypothetical protein DV010_05395 [Escherichia coli]|nr:hypothetical protein [Escherichia coli]EFN7967562.1 hypothetical protein [Escherichia coli]EFN8041396.1 hypothetical protein [Escherichia coli]EFO0911141.1 hypothetical protein [Escherichia coli]EFO1719269.1 hypothetical protein [Escherichia coli]